MNINVVVLNVLHDFRPADAGDRARELEGHFSRTPSKSATVTPGDDKAIEEVIELMPQDGTWAGKAFTKAARAASYSLAQERRSLASSPAVTTYDRAGNIHHPSQEKGLRVNITA